MEKSLVHFQRQGRDNKIKKKWEPRSEGASFSRLICKGIIENEIKNDYFFWFQRRRLSKIMAQCITGVDKCVTIEDMAVTNCDYLTQTGSKLHLPKLCLRMKNTQIRLNSSDSLSSSGQLKTDMLIYEQGR